MDYVVFIYGLMHPLMVSSSFCIVLSKCIFAWMSSSLILGCYLGASLHNVLRSLNAVYESGTIDPKAKAYCQPISSPQDGKYVLYRFYEKIKRHIVEARMA